MSKLTPEKRDAFCAVLADGGSVSHAARAIGISRQAMYAARGHDSELALDWDDAVERGTDCLEDEAVRRGKDTSDTLLIFMLKARRPEKYRERHDFNVRGTAADASDSDLAAIALAGGRTSSSST